MIKTYFHTKTHMPEANQIVADFVSQRIWGQAGIMTECATMGVVRDGTLVGGVIFSEYRKETGTLHFSAAGDAGKWLSRRVINDAMRLAFDVIGAEVVYVMVADDNTEALRVNRTIFPNDCHVKHLYGAGKHGSMLTMSKDEWLTHRLYKP